MSGVRWRLAHGPADATVSCFSKIQIGFTFLVPAHPDSPGQRTVKRLCVCVCVCVTRLEVMITVCKSCLVLQILHADTVQVCGTNDTGFVCDGTKSTFRVLFKEPVEIHANTSYIACATLKVICFLSCTELLAIWYYLQDVTSVVLLGCISCMLCRCSLLLQISPLQYTASELWWLLGG